jgi:hypothetical protein
MLLLLMVLMVLMVLLLIIIKPNYEYIESNVNDHNELIKAFHKGFLTNNIKTLNELIIQSELDIETIKNELHGKVQNVDNFFTLILQKATNIMEKNVLNDNKKFNETRLTPYEVTSNKITISNDSNQETQWSHDHRSNNESTPNHNQTTSNNYVYTQRHNNHGRYNNNRGSYHNNHNRYTNNQQSYRSRRRSKSQKNNNHSYNSNYSNNSNSNRNYNSNYSNNSNSNRNYSHETHRGRVNRGNRGIKRSRSRSRFNNQNYHQQQQRFLEQGHPTNQRR